MGGRKRREYEIGTGKGPVIASAIMLAIFGGLAFWLYKVRNGAYIFCGLLAGVMLLLLLLTLYRMLFYRIKIGADEFCYRTNHMNARSFGYSRLKRAWISEGRVQNGYRAEYCNVETDEGEVIRFQFFGADSDAVRSLIKRIEESENSQSVDAGELKIDGKVYGKSRVVIALVIFITVLVINTSLLGSLPESMRLLSQLGAAVMLAVVGLVVMQYFCFEVRIEEKGFYLKTALFNDAYYEYGEIVSCREIERVVKRGRRGHRRNPSYYYYFEFTDIRGKTRKFQFEKPLYSHEVEVLSQRIEKK